MKVAVDINGRIIGWTELDGVTDHDYEFENDLFGNEHTLQDWKVVDGELVPLEPEDPPAVLPKVIELTFNNSYMFSRTQEDIPVLEDWARKPIQLSWNIDCDDRDIPFSIFNRDPQYPMNSTVVLGKVVNKVLTLDLSLPVGEYCIVDDNINSLIRPKQYRLEPILIRMILPPKPEVNDAN